MKVPFSPPKINQETIDAVTEVLNSGWITTGPKTKEFEDLLSDYTGAKKVLAANSATAGLELILRWYGVGPGDEVIVPSYTYCSTANVVLHCGATPVMCDIKNDFNIDPKEIEEKITEKTKVIIPVDLGGFPADYDLINDIAKRNKEKFRAHSPEQEKLGRILVMSDAAHSIGAKMNGSRTGNLTDVTVFSFHAVKNLTTVEGGSICLNLPEPFDNEEIYKSLRTFSLHGQSKDAFSKTKVGGWEYDVAFAGYKCNMPDILAVIGLVELNRYSETLERRAAVFKMYHEALSNYSWAELPVYSTLEKESSYHVYLLRIKGVTKEQRDSIMQEMYNREIAVNIHFKPLPLLSLYKGLGYSMEKYPKAMDAYKREISLPVFYDMTNEQVKMVIDNLVEVISNVLGV